MLEEEDIEECSNNNTIAHCISENIALKERNESLKNQVNESIGIYKTERMKVEEIEMHLKSMEKNYKEIL